MNEILIIGSGFAAGVLALHLIESKVKPNLITIIGPGTIGFGNAYGSFNDNYRLNVRAQIMWIKPNERNDFMYWAKNKIYDPEAHHSAGVFYQRKDFGRYINSKLSCLTGFNEIMHYKNKVKELIFNNYKTKNNFSWKVILDNGKIINTRYVVLATGNPSPEWPCKIDKSFLSLNHKFSSRLIQNPWVLKNFNKIDKLENISLLGSGLTSLDILLALYSRGHRGCINVFSKSGEFPPVQANWKKEKSPKWPGINNRFKASDFINFIKSYLPDHPTSSIKWQSAWEELRDEISFNWLRLSQKDMLLLKKHFGSFWSRLRYRASPQTIDAVNNLIKSNQLRIHKARVTEIGLKNNKLFVFCSNLTKHESDIIINCSGVGKDKLISKLIQDGYALTDNLNISLKVNLDNVVLSKLNKLQSKPSLFMIGPNLEASLGDISSASKISMQALRLAKHLKNIL